jgi:hypothetical protein
MTRNTPSCTWCAVEAITTVVQMPACQAHHDEYCRRRRQGEEWAVISEDLWRCRRAEENQRRVTEGV